VSTRSSVHDYVSDDRVPFDYITTVKCHLILWQLSYYSTLDFWEALCYEAINAVRTIMSQLDIDLVAVNITGLESILGLL
jgi:hypothetical protein